MSAVAGGLVLGLGLLLPAVTLVAPVRAAVSVFYVDCSGGSDSGSGTTPATAWRSLTRANTAPLTPGSSLLLKRGCTWTGPLNASWTGTAGSPITIGAYGTGAQPLIRNAHTNVVITGSHLVIRDLATRADPTGRDASCDNWPLGYRVGFRFMNGADHVTVRDSTASDLYIGVKVDAGATDNVVASNVLRDNDMRDPNVGSDAGAVGILLEGDRTDVVGNTISGSDACSPFYGRDGAAVEVYGGRDNRVHHNVATQNNAFTELGNPRSANNTFAYNRITSTLRDANVLVTRGGSDAKYGPVSGTRFHNNTAYLTGAAGYAIQCTYGCGPSILSMRDNIIWSNDRVGYADAAFDEGHNIYWRAGGSPKVYFPISASSRKVDPRLVSTASLDLRLAADSPAIDAGSSAAARLGYTTDLTGVAVPQGPASDIGAHERPAGSATPTPAATASPIAADSFARTVAGSWGSTGVGGTYRHWGTRADFAVDGAAGRMALDPGQALAAALDGTSARDIDARVLVSVSRLAGGTGSAAFLTARRSLSTGNEYRLRVRIAPNGAVYLAGLKTVGGRTVSLGAEVRSGRTVVAGSRLWIRVRVTGAGPTRLLLRVWRYGTREPTRWQYAASDRTTALAGRGAVGLRGTVSSRSGGGSVRILFDNLRVVRP